MTVTAFQQANQLLREGKLEAAVVVYRQAIEQNPDSYLSYQNLGETLGKLGRLDQSVEMYRKAIELKPSAGWLHQELGLLLERLEKNQEKPPSHFAVGDREHNFSSIQTQKTILPKNKLQSMPPLLESTSDIQHRDQRKNANFIEEINRQPDNLQVYYQDLKTKPKSGDLYLQLGSALAKQKRFNEAIVIYKILFKVEPDSANAANAYQEVKKCLFELQSV
jgi:tetratricopeptide (TPR) repeat protein